MKSIKIKRGNEKDSSQKNTAPKGKINISKNDNNNNEKEHHDSPDLEEIIKSASSFFNFNSSSLVMSIFVLVIGILIFSDLLRVLEPTKNDEEKSFVAKELIQEKFNNPVVLYESVRSFIKDTVQEKAEELANKPVALNESVSAFIKDTVQEKAEELASKPVALDESVSAFIKDMVQEQAKELANKPVALDESVKALLKDIVQEQTEKSIKEYAQNINQEKPKEVTKEKPKDFLILVTDDKKPIENYVEGYGLSHFKYTFLKNSSYGIVNIDVNYKNKSLPIFFSKNKSNSQSDFSRNVTIYDYYKLNEYYICPGSKKYEYSKMNICGKIEVKEAIKSIKSIIKSFNENNH